MKPLKSAASVKGTFKMRSLSRTVLAVIFFGLGLASHAEVPDDVRKAVPGGALKSGVRARCLIVLRGKTEFRGFCNLTRKPNDNVTEIDPEGPMEQGAYRYFIVREHTNANIAVFLRNYEENPAENLGDVESAGNCWRGLRVTFCAE